MEALRGEVTCPMSHSNELAELELEPGPQDSVLRLGLPRKWEAWEGQGCARVPRTSILGRKRSCTQVPRWGQVEWTGGAGQPG